MGKFAGAALAAVVAAATFSSIATTPAYATESDCKSGQFCLWDGRHFDGLILIPSITGHMTHLSNRGFDNAASSFMNRTSSTWCLYEDTNYRGRLLVRISPGTRGALTLGPNGDDNRASSVTRCAAQ